MLSQLTFKLKWDYIFFFFFTVQLWILLSLKKLASLE